MGAHRRPEAGVPGMGGTQMTLFDNCCADIESEYRRLGHRLGWRFLSGPKATLSPASRIAFITLNPGGDYDSPDHPHESQEAGSAYLVESWGDRPAGQSKLQIQVGALFGHLAARVGDGNRKALMNASLVGYFIPFRSPSYDTLVNKADSLNFGERLWARIFEHIEPQIVITMDTNSFKRVRGIIKNRRPGDPERHVQLPTGWGNYMADVIHFGGSGNRVTLARLPHLSRFTIFTSSKCRAAVPRLMDEIALADGVNR